MAEHGTARTVRSVLLALALLAAGVGAVLLAGDLPGAPQLPLPWWGLLLGYLVAERFTLGFPRREDSVLVGLTQLPLALGVLLVAPLVHLGVRLVATLVDCVLRGRGPLKTSVNLALAALEVGVATGVVAVLRSGELGPSREGPLLWGALLLGLLLAGTASQVGLSVLFRVLGMHRTRRELTEPLAVEALSSVAFTGLAVLTVEAASSDPWTLGVVAALAGFVAASYRAYRRLVAQQRTTEDLYAFVKVLGPVDVEHPDALPVLEHMRALLHARHLELAVADQQGDLGRRLTVDLEGAPQLSRGLLEAPLPAADLQSERMVTPLVVGGSVLGLLTARRRVTNDRGFDMRDLRLFETVATELALAVERGRLLRDLGRAAATDPMTGLPNLRSTTQGLDRLLVQHEQVVFAAVAVDSFREVNDTLGHQVGDDLLREAARRLHAAAPRALVGRIGGKRFGIALPLADAGGDGALFGLTLRSRVEGGAQLRGVSAHLRLSVGVVGAPDHGSDAATLLRRAETAMYSARLAHGGPVVWEPAYEVEGQRRLAVVAALREALESGAVGVAFQPKVCAHTGAVQGVEALARWTHPALGSIEPDEFVPLAEAAGLMAALTRTVLHQALTTCHGWQGGDRPVGVSVNVSADTLQDGGFVTEVASILHRAGLPADLLTLELTEDVVVDDPLLAAERMHELRALGIRLSVDDFGTGYSSLTYLKGLPIDEVKIDRGFVAGIVEDAGDQAVVRAVVDIAHTLGMTVVAEGVEREAQHGLLRTLGVDQEQGHLHARPMPASEMATWLRGQADVGRPRQP